MGQHKNNPNAILKKQGKIEPKKRNQTAQERRDLLGKAFGATSFGKIVASVNNLTGNKYK